MTTWTGPHPLDRCEDRRRDRQWVASLWPSASVLAVTADGRVAASIDGLTWAEPDGGYDDQRHHLLGLVDGRPLFVQEVPQAPALLRDVMDGLASPDLQVAFTAVALIGWHSHSAFCPVCGSTTLAAAGGLLRHCVRCGHDLYPRTDPAVIVAITDADDRLLLGRQPRWPPGRVSVFAGFVEAGESLEQAVRREIAEEVGIHLDQISYLSSQPWPFPRSLMVAFGARTEGAEPQLLDGEIERARWFSRAELAAAMASGSVLLPNVSSVANRMIHAWLDGHLDRL